MSDTLSELSTELFTAKAEKAEHNAQIKLLNEDIRDYEHRIWQIMETADPPLLKFSTRDGTIYISPQVVPKVVDWDAFYGYIRKTEAFHMLERRPSRAAFRELHEAHKLVPGVEAVEYDEVRTRKS
jgi:hypothetical protein